MNMNAEIPSLAKLAIAKIIERCEQLENNKDIEGMYAFMALFPRPILCELADNELIQKAWAQFCFYIGNYTEMYRTLKNHQFSHWNHQELQTMWYEARYKEAAKQRGRNLDDAAKCRVRKKFPLPRTIRKRRHVFNKRSHPILREHFLSVLHNPYPDAATKKDLADQTGLTPMQVSNWFNNLRHRFFAANRT
uniref:Homeobox domain-containing protein n=1 Tax=Panagrellus redivivus TaxID=6233 RepID=A0A7E4VTE6_PANRE